MAEPAASRVLPRTVLMLGLCSFFTDAASEMILPLLPALMLGTMAASPLWLGAVDGIADALSAVLKLVSGRIADRVPRKKPLVLIGYGLSTAARPLIGFALVPLHIVWIRALDRVGKGIRSAPRDALLSESVSAQDAPRAFAFHRMMDHGGAVVGPLLASVLLALGLGVRNVIACAWIPGALALVALLLVKETPRVVAANPKRDGKGPRVPLPPAMRRFLVGVALFGAGTLPDMFLLVRARDLGMHDALVPVVWVALHMAKVLGAGVIAQRARTGLRMLLVGWLLVGLGAVGLLVEHVGVVWVVAGVLGLGHGLREPLEKEIVRATHDATTRGGAFGVYHLVVGFSSLAAGLCTGWLWSAWGISAVVAVGVVASCAALVVVWSTVRSVSRQS